MWLKPLVLLLFFQPAKADCNRWNFSLKNKEIINQHYLPNWFLKISPPRVAKWKLFCLSKKFPDKA
jgi:hypothetical protein